MRLSTSFRADKLTVSFQGVSKECYAAMQSETALALTAPYHVEELKALEAYLQRSAAEGQPIEHFVAIGCGNLRYMDIALRFCKTYTAIDPTLEDQVSPQKKEYLKPHRNIRILGKALEEVTADELPPGRKLFFFLFNVFPYIEGALTAQQLLCNRGDGVVISAWNDKSSDASRLQEIYYDYLNETYSCSLARSDFSGYIDELEKNSAVFCSGTERLTGKTTDILTLKI